MEILRFIRDYWTQIVFLFATISAFVTLYKAYRRATLCSLRNDILEIWDKCKNDKKITRFQLESYTESRDLYFKLKGNGFVHALYEQISKFEIID